MSFFLDNLHTVSSFSRQGFIEICPWVQEIPPHEGFFSAEELADACRASGAIGIEHADYYSRYLDNFEKFSNGWHNNLAEAPTSWLECEFGWKTDHGLRFVDHGVMFSDLLMILAATVSDTSVETAEGSVSALESFDLGRALLVNKLGFEHLAAMPSVGFNAYDVKWNPLMDRFDLVDNYLREKKFSAELRTLIAEYGLSKVVIAIQPIDAPGQFAWYESNFGPMEVYRYHAAFQGGFEKPIYSNNWMPRPIANPATRLQKLRGWLIKRL